MVLTIVYFLLASIVLGTIAAPGLAALALAVVPLAGVALIWRIALTVVTHGHPSEAVVHTRPGHLLGPGGPDDSFAPSALVGDEYPTGASASARNGLVHGANVPRPSLSETLSLRPRGENSVPGGGR